MARPLPDPVLFLDECLGTTDVAAALRAKGCKVEILLDHFATGTLDEEWLPDVGQRGWIVLSKDKWIRKRAVERRALMDSGTAAFVLTSGDMKGSEMAEAFCKAYPRMRKLLRDRVAPFIAAVHGNGSIKLLTDPPRRGGVKRR